MIILAAGVGSRLKENLPKALVKLDENLTILDHQLENLMGIVEMKDIKVVVGFKKDLIIDKYPYISFVHNNNYAETNTSKSLLIALEKFSDQDILWINGDVVFQPDILHLVQNSQENLVCVNNFQVTDEEVKYTIDSQGYLKDISKDVPNALGEAVGINFIKKEDLKQFIACLNKCEELDYFEKGIELAIKNGMKFIPLDIKDNFCLEVDFPEDLIKARNYIHGVK